MCSNSPRRDHTVPHDASSNDSENDTPIQAGTITGFEGILRPTSFNELSKAALEGEVVIPVALPNNSIALVLGANTGENDSTGKGKDEARAEGENCQSTPLAIGSEELAALRRQLRVTLETRNHYVPSSGEGVRTTNTSGSNVVEGVLGDVQLDQAGKIEQTEEKDSGMESILSTLWEKVAQPVIEHLTSMEKPGINDRKRIWWCLTRAFASLPIHAAGAADGKLNVSDFFISSYTPSLSALIHARRRPIPSPESTKVLAAIQPNPGNGWQELPGVRAELEEVHKLVPSQHLISLSHPTRSLEPSTSIGGSAGYNIDPEGVHATCANILSRLPSASILHLACHASQRKSNPLQNGFVLYDGKELTTEMLTESQVEANGGSRCVAVLNTRNTSMLGEELPNEFINLANVMLFTGFRSVSTTMWPMNDSDGLIISQAIYRELFGPKVNGDLTKFCLATVLDGVMREMRETGYSCDRWATFYHIGA